MNIKNIEVEYLTSPLGIDVVSPRINWTLEGVQKQVSFEVIYSLDGKKKTSGKVVSSSMHYDFPIAFSSRDHIDFQIKVSDGKEEIISKPSYFEMGLLKKEDWQAKWISGNYKPSKKQRYPADYFRKKFESKKIVKARLYISALGVYEASINGNRVGNFIMAPGSTDYRKRVQYQTYDVTNLLKEGENEFSLILGDGWYRGCIGAKGDHAVYGKQTAFIAQLELTSKDGEIATIASDDSFFWSNDGAIRFADFKDGEIVDLNLKPSYQDRAIIVDKKANLTASNNNFIQENETFQPLKASPSKTGKMTYEFTQNLAGYLSLEVNAHQGDKIDIVLGELLDENGDVSLKNIQCIKKGKKTPLQEIHIICKEGKNIYHPKFMYAGFRYASISSPVEIPLENIHQIACYTKFEETSTFECSSSLINTFYRNTLWSLKSNSFDVPTDCPTRERMGWTGDSQVFFNTACFLTNYACFARKHLVDVYDRQQSNGCLPQIAPYNAEDWFMNVMNGSVGWADVGVLTPYRFYLRYGDKRILEENYERMAKYAKFMIKRCGRAKGIYSLYARPLHLSKENRRYGVNTGQSYGEWAEPNDVKAFEWTDFAEPHPEESMAYTSFILSVMVDICNLLNKKEDIELFKRYSDGVKAAYQELVTKPKFSLDTDRQAKLVRPLYMNLLTNEQKEYAKKRLIEALEHYRWRLGTGFLSTPLILEVLSGYDVEAAYRLLENEEMPGWLYMAKHSTGTIWEGWEGLNAQEGISSLNHYSKGAMVEWLFSSMCGIKIEKENHFLLKPIIGGHITYAKASYDSIYGKVALSWEKKDGHIVFNIDVPSNTEASFVFKDHQEDLSTGHHEIALLWNS